jgi:uncharacterized repeat protein (TIGR03803 family)
MKKLWFISLAMVSFALASFSSSQTFNACPVPTSQSYTLLHSFGTNGHGPNDPHSSIIAQSRGGNMVSTATDTWTGGDGTVFKINTNGAVTTLHTFNGTDGFEPLSGLTLSTGGHYWGTTAQGGLYGHGTVFKMTAGGALTTLHDFTGGADGGLPGAPPIEGIDENFYGTTGAGGKSGSNGTVYRISSSGTFQTLHSFGATSQGYPNGPLVQGSDGFLYGTTFYGGGNGVGTIFRISVSGEFKTLASFGGGTFGAYPFGPLIEGLDGNLYGVASGNGGSNGGGVLFKVSLSGKLTILHKFTGGSDGSNPVGGLLQATDGNLYGTNDVGGGSGWGVLFCYSPGAVPTGQTRFHVLHDFNLATGASPQVSLLQHTNGKLYGDTAVGGSANRGAFYSFDAGLGPFISFMPRARRVGHGVKILGQGFTGATGVSFNGTPASFVVVSDTFIQAVIPDHATSGFLTVKTPNGTLTSNRTFLVKPQIVAFTPAGGAVGTTVVIDGISLKQTSKITFNSVVALNFTVNSDSQITVVVPSGAQSGKIGITTIGAPVYSTNEFLVTP